jgi:hypothetical protein
MARGRRGRTRHDHQVQAAWEIAPAPAEALPDPAFHAVAQHRAANFAAHGDPDSPAARQGEEEKVRPRDPTTPALNRQVVLTAAHPRRTRKALAPPLGDHRGGQGSLLLRHRHGELSAPFAPTTANNLAAGPRPHALSKAVRALAALAVRLKRPLHDILRDFAVRLARQLKAECNSIAHPGCQRSSLSAGAASEAASRLLRASRRFSPVNFESRARRMRQSPWHAAFRHRL